MPSEQRLSRPRSQHSSSSPNSTGGDEQIGEGHEYRQEPSSISQSEKHAAHGGRTFKQAIEVDSASMREPCCAADLAGGDTWISLSALSRTPSPSPSQPRKRRRIVDGSPRTSIVNGGVHVRHRRTMSPTNKHSHAKQHNWQARPLFGCVSDLSSITAAEERRSVIRFLNEYRAGKESGFALQCRLTEILQTVEWWGLVGCILYFVTTGQMQPNHEMSSCTMTAYREEVMSVLRWLESLYIPRSNFLGIGFCSLCAAFHPCNEVILGDRVGMAHPSDAQDYWVKELESKVGTDGHCERKPIVRQVIAAFSVYDDFFLWKIMTKLASDQEGTDLMMAQQARAWFEKRIPFKEYWFPQMLLAYETVVLSFYERQNRNRQAPPLCGFPDQPAALAPKPLTMGSHGAVALSEWTEMDDLINWDACLDGWVGKCSFCAGRGFRGCDIQHERRRCNRGGKTTLRSGLAEGRHTAV